MKIEIKEPGSESFHREIVCVSGQYRRLLKHPEAKLRNQFRGFKGNILLCAALLAVVLGMAFAWGGDTMTWVAVAVMVICIALNAALLVQYNRLLRSLMERGGTAVLTLDEKGVEFDRPGVQMLRQSWDSVAFVRVFQESVCFLPKEAGSLIIAVDHGFTPQIIDALREYAPQIRVY